MIKTDWIRCPACGEKTRDKIRADTEMKNFPVFCPKCKKRDSYRCKTVSGNCYAEASR